MRWDPITRQPLYDCPICLDEGWESRTYQQDGAKYMGQPLPPDKAAGLYRAGPCQCKRGVAIAASRWREFLKHQAGAAMLERLRSDKPAFAAKLMAYLGEHPDVPGPRTAE